MYKRLIPAVLLVAYACFLIKWMVLKDVPLIRIGQLMLNFGGTAEGTPNFMPFATIAPYLMGHKGLIIAGINLVGNIVLLVPLGFLVPFVFRGITWQKKLALATVSCLAIELLQVVMRVGIFDIDDVILNVLGFMIGYWAFVVGAKLMRSLSTKALSVAAITSIVVVSAAAAYGYQKFPIRFEAAVVGEHSGPTGSGEDLCGGTGGNGQVVSISGNSFVMERKDGSTLTVTLTSAAEVKTQAGTGSIADLKVGDRATLVGDANADGSFTAYAVFVCGASGTENQQ